MSIDDSSWKLMREIRARLAAITDDHTRRSTKAWVEAWDDVVDDLDAALTELALQAGEGRIRRATVIRSARLTKALDAIQTKLADLFDDAAQDAIDGLRDVVLEAGGTQEQLIGSQLPPDDVDVVKSWSTVNTKQVDAIVTRAAENITKASYPLSDSATAAMRRELVRGLVAGKNPRATAARMVKRTEGLFNGGLARALTIARTETLDAHRAAARATDLENADIMAGWVWAAALGARTCPACWGMNGTFHEIEESGPDGHQNCRCQRMPKTKTWAELGFDVEEPPPIEQDAGAVFGALPAGTQREILGKRGYDAWKSGAFPMSEWATRRKNPGWRDSYVPARAPAAA